MICQPVILEKKLWQIKMAGSSCKVKKLKKGQNLAVISISFMILSVSVRATMIF